MKLLLILVATVGLAACSSTVDNRDPTGELFPTISSVTLDEQAITLPADLDGRKAVLLVAYEHGTQFDVDRWLMGLLQAEVDAAILELPTLPGIVPSLGSKWIDDGMRSGIPQEDWSIVVTLYGDAASPVVDLTGNEKGRNTRVLVLDEAGRIVWFDDSGYSARKALDIARLVAAGADTD